MFIPGINYMVAGYIKQVRVITFSVSIFKTGDLSSMLRYKDAFGNKYFGKQSLSGFPAGVPVQVWAIKIGWVMVLIRRSA